MVYVYVLQLEKGKYYIGKTKNPYFPKYQTYNDSYNINNYLYSQTTNREKQITLHLFTINYEFLISLFLFICCNCSYVFIRILFDFIT